MEITPNATPVSVRTEMLWVYATPFGCDYVKVISQAPTDCPVVLAIVGVTLPTDELVIIVPFPFTTH